MADLSSAPGTAVGAISVVTAGAAGGALPSAEAYSALFVSAFFPDACATHAGPIEAQPNATNSVPTLRTLLSISASHRQCRIVPPFAVALDSFVAPLDLSAEKKMTIGR
jgi:hypothetical protein